MQFNVKHLFMLVTLVAIRLGMPSVLAMLLSVPSKYYWASELFQLPLNVFWILASYCVYQRRESDPIAALFALTALFGFIAGSAIGSVRQIFISAALIKDRPLPEHFVWLGWNWIAPFFNVACWVTLPLQTSPSWDR